MLIRSKILVLFSELSLEIIHFVDSIFACPDGFDYLKDLCQKLALHLLIRNYARQFFDDRHISEELNERVYIGVERVLLQTA